MPLADSGGRLARTTHIPECCKTTSSLAGGLEYRAVACLVPEVFIEDRHASASHPKIAPRLSTRRERRSDADLESS